MFVDDDHPSFLDKPDAAALVWRYMDLARYLSLIQNGCLHFARADQMADRWEGSYSQMNLALRPGLYGEHYEKMAAARAGLRASTLQRTHLSCWHLAEVESAAMWEIYQREGRGVAVRSTWGDLTGSITSERAVYGARVRYVDYSSTFIPESNTFDAFMHKRQSFSHEREVRLIMLTGHSEPHPTEKGTAIDLGPEPEVIPVGINLTRLVHDVYVAPDAPKWIAEVVADVSAKYGYVFPVRQSDLGTDPIE